MYLVHVLENALWYIGFVRIKFLWRGIHVKVSSQFELGRLDSPVCIGESIIPIHSLCLSHSKSSSYTRYASDAFTKREGIQITCPDIMN